MIELLLQAERALAMGLVDQAERCYRQAADADPRNSIAVVGLARVALERGDEPGAWREARRALEIDPENAAALRLAGRLEEVWAYRGESLPEAAGRPGTPPVALPDPAGNEAAAAVAAAPTDPGAAAPAPTPSAPAASAPAPSAPAPRAARPKRGLVDRLLRRKRP